MGAVQPAGRPPARPVPADTAPLRRHAEVRAELMAREMGIGKGKPELAPPASPGSLWDEVFGRRGYEPRFTGRGASRRPASHPETIRRVHAKLEKTDPDAAAVLESLVFWLAVCDDERGGKVRS